MTTPAEFEQLVKRTGWTCARKIIRCQHTRWYDWRDGIREIPPYIQASIDAHAKLFRAGLLPLPEDGRVKHPERCTRRRE